MKVKELIEKLKEFDPDLYIHRSDGEGGFEYDSISEVIHQDICDDLDYGLNTSIIVLK